MSSKFKSTKLGFESLESRMMLDGNVMASVVNGSLVVIGDQSDNKILIENPAPGQYAIKSGNTLVNGQDASDEDGVVFSGVTGNLYLYMNGGNDAVKLDNPSGLGRAFTLPGSLWVRLGAGDDKLGIGVTEDDLGNPVPTGHAVNIKASAYIYAEAGNDKIGLANTRIERGSLFAHLGSGNDQLMVLGRDGDGPFPNGRPFLDVCRGSLCVLGDSGNDTVDLAHTRVARSMLASLGDGHDSLRLASSSIGGSATLDGGRGYDQCQIRDSAFASMTISNFEKRDVTSNPLDLLW